MFSRWSTFLVKVGMPELSPPAGGHMPVPPVPVVRGAMAIAICSISWGMSPLVSGADVPSVDSFCVSVTAAPRVLLWQVTACLPVWFAMPRA